MSNILWKKFNLCFSKFKCPPPTSPSPPPLPSQKPPPSTNHNRPISPATTSTTTMIKNLNSICDLTSSTSTTTDTFFSPSSSSDIETSSTSSKTTTTPPNFATIFASQRFFFSSPGRSNSIFEYSSPETPPPESDTLVNGGFAFSKYSPDPYSDFRRSMQEMVEAREEEIKDNNSSNSNNNNNNNWDYLHELLLCYLTLNPKHTHKYILRAFSDLVVSLMSSSSKNVDGGYRRRKDVSRRLLL